MRSEDWTSLEIVKLIVATLTPLVVAYAGYRLTVQQAELASSRTRDNAKQAQLNIINTKLLDRRTEIWDKLGPIYSRLALLASENEITENDKNLIKDLHRQTNEHLLTYQLYFSPGFLLATQQFDFQIENFLGGSPADGAQILGLLGAIRQAAANDMGLTFDPSADKIRDHLKQR